MDANKLSLSPRSIVGRKILIIALLGLALTWVLLLLFQYHETKRPVSRLYGMPPMETILIRQPPSFVQGFYGKSDGTTDSRLVSPLGVAVSPSGDRVYATNSGGSRTTAVFDRTGTSIGQLAPPQTEPGGRFPVYAAVDRSGFLYISDRLRGVIDVYSPTGEYQDIYRPVDEPPLAPMALAFDPDGNLYVTDLVAGTHRVLVYGPDGKLKLAVGKEGTGPGELSFPNGVTADAKGRIYVADSNNGRVQIFASDGTLLDIIGRSGRGALGIPRGVVVDELGRLFIVDTSAQMVEVWDVNAEPKKLYTIGGGGIGDAELSYPNSVAIDGTGRVYVADRANGRVQVWTY